MARQRRDGRSQARLNIIHPGRITFQQQ
jgi:hypothetical protein